MSEKTSKEEVKEVWKGGKFVLGICISIIIILIGIVIFLLLRKDSQEVIDSEIAGRGIVVNQNNVKEVVEQIAEEPEPVPIGTYEVTMNNTWNFSDGTSSSKNAYVENSKSNTSDVYFDVTRSDTGEIIYSSPVLPVGTFLEDITLDTVLSKGKYDCVITYHILDETGKTQSTVRLTLTVMVEQ